MAGSGYIVWGPELSPFLLKLESMLAWRRVPWRRLPRDGTRLENLRTALRVSSAVRRRTALRPPQNDPLDEYPLVPFLIAPDGQVLYDSSALARWLDLRFPETAPPLLPRTGAELFVCALIDEAFDEFGLYMVHHNRWKLAATDNDEPGRRLAREYRRLLPPGLGAPFARWFARRQVRRLPYLFSVAPAGYRVSGLPERLTPPSRRGFPVTHELLEDAWRRYLAAMETVLSSQPFLLGDAFTLADASAYGQLSMNLTDGLAAHRLRQLAPTTFAWLAWIRDRGHAAARIETSTPLQLSPSLASLLDVIGATYVPLMKANAAACSRLLDRGDRDFNERAFDRGRSIHHGELLGHPYRTVAKSFQARAWRDLCRLWSSLDAGDRDRVARLAPVLEADETFVCPPLR